VARTLTPPEEWLLACIAGALLAAATPGLAFETSGAPLEIELARNSLATADFGDARLGGTENRLAIRGPSMPAGEGELRWALDYAYQRYEYQGLASRNRDLHRLELPLSWHTDAAYAWAIELRPIVASSSNVFKDLWSRGGSDDLMLHGRLTRVHAPAGEGWGWRLGAARDDAFGQERTYPVVAVLHQAGRLRAAWGWPETQLAWQATPQLDVGAGIGPAGEPGSRRHARRRRRSAGSSVRCRCAPQRRADLAAPVVRW
jgi:hypothetical protein